MAQAGLARQHGIVQAHLADLAHAALLFKGHSRGHGRRLLGTRRCWCFHDLPCEGHVHMHRKGDQVIHTHIYIISNDSGMNVHQSRVCDKIAFLFFNGKSDDMRPPISSSTHFHITIPVMNGHDTVDERNPAPVNG